MQINTVAIFDSLMLVAILSLFLERALALIFEQKFIARLIKGKGLKEILAFATCYAVCKLWGVDIVSLMVNQTEVKDLGIVLTSTIVAGGSKVSIKLFQDVIGLGKIRKEEISNDNTPVVSVIPSGTGSAS